MYLSHSVDIRFDYVLAMMGIRIKRRKKSTQSKYIYILFISFLSEIWNFTHFICMVEKQMDRLSNSMGERAWVKKRKKICGTSQITRLLAFSFSNRIRARARIYHPQRLDLQWDKSCAVYRRSVSISARKIYIQNQTMNAAQKTENRVNHRDWYLNSVSDIPHHATSKI